MAAPASPPPPPASSERVRSRFLQRIGIVHPAAATSPPRPASKERSALRGAPRRTEKLRYRYDHRREEAEGGDEGGGGEEQRQPGRRRVSFEEAVTVVPIPTRYEYSGRIRTRLWSSSVEMRQTAERNFVEFAAEDLDWRNVCQERDMHLCHDTRELIHPVHVEIGHYTFGTGGACRRTYEPPATLSQICRELSRRRPSQRADRCASGLS